MISTTWCVLLISLVVSLVMGGWLAICISLSCLFVMFLVEVYRVWSKI